MIRNKIRIIYFRKHFCNRKSLMIVSIWRKRFLSYLTKNCEMLRQKRRGLRANHEHHKAVSGCILENWIFLRKNCSWWANVTDRKSDWEAKLDQRLNNFCFSIWIFQKKLLENCLKWRYHCCSGQGLVIEFRNWKRNWKRISFSFVF